MTVKLDRILLTLAAPVLAIVLALIVSTGVLLVSGNSPGEVFALLGDQTTQLGEIVKTINRAGPYYISAVAVAVGFKMNLFNIGVEGQYRLAGVTAAAAGAALPLPGPLRVIGILAVAILVGGAWAGIAGVLRAYRGVSEVISTIMLNAIALGLTPFLLTRWFQEDKSGEVVDFAIRTQDIPSGGRVPQLDGLIPGDLAGGVHLNGFVIIAALVGIGYWLLIWRSRFGYDLRASGANPWAARASGVDSRRMIVLAMVISGGIAGLVGLSTIIGEAPYRYTQESFLGGLGFTGIAIALLGRNNPVGIAFGALLWSFMDIAKTPMSRADLPREITTIIQGIAVLSVVIAYQVVERAAQRREAAITARADDGRPPGDPPDQPDQHATAGAPA